MLFARMEEKSYLTFRTLTSFPYSGATNPKRCCCSHNLVSNEPLHGVGGRQSKEHDCSGSIPAEDIEEVEVKALQIVEAARWTEEPSCRGIGFCKW